MNIYTIVEFSFFCLVFRGLFGWVWARRALLALMGCFVAFALVNLLFLQGEGRFNSLSMGLENGLLMLVALAYFAEMFRQTRVKYLERHPQFWLAGGALLYFAGNLLLFVCINYVLKSDATTAYADWGIHSGTNLAANLCYTTALWLIPGS